MRSPGKMRYNVAMTPKEHSRRAFTLIELLVVTSIIAMLMGILLPVLGRVRRGARSVVCMANVKRLAMAGVMYAQTNGAFPPHRMKRQNFTDAHNFVNEYGRDRPRWRFSIRSA